jgi:hypothetical protein
MAELPKNACLTCLGSGEVSSERGPAVCPDCDGTGRVGALYRRGELRLRSIERKLERMDGELHADIAWLVDETRRYREHLLRIVAHAQDTPNDDPIIRSIRAEGIDALGLYERAGTVPPKVP